MKILYLTLLCVALPIRLLAADEFVTSKEVDVGMFINDWTPPSVSADGTVVLYQGTFGYGFVFAKTEDGQPLPFNPSLGIENKNTLEHAWAPRGAVIALNDKSEGKQHCALWDLKTGNQRVLFRYPKRSEGAWNDVSSMDWSPDGNYLYVIMKLELPRYRIPASKDTVVWRNKDTDIEVAGIPGFNTDHEHSFSDHMATLQAWLEKFKRTPDAYGEGACSVILVCDVNSGELRMLARGNDFSRVYPSPDGKWLAVVQQKRMSREKEAWAGQVLSDVFLFPVKRYADLPPIDIETWNVREIGAVDSDGKNYTPALRDQYLPPSNRASGDIRNAELRWAPDSQAFAFATLGRMASGDVFVYSLGTGQLTDLTSKIEMPKWTRGDGYAEYYQRREYLTPRFGRFELPVWLPDSRGLLAIARGEVWQIPVAGGGSPRPLPNRLPHEARAILTDDETGRLVADSDGSFYVLGKDGASRCDSILRARLDSPEWNVALETGLWVNRHVCGLPDSRQLVLWGQNPHSLTEIFRADLNGKPELTKLTHYKDHLIGKKWLPQQIFTYQTKSGRKAYGWLTLPEGCSPSAPVPLVMEVSVNEEEFNADSLIDQRFQWGGMWVKAIDTELGAQRLRQKGIALLQVNLPLTSEGEVQEPLNEVVEGLNAAYAAAVATKVIDPSRVALVAGSVSGPVAPTIVGIAAVFCPQFKTGIIHDGWGNPLALHNSVWLHQAPDNDFFVHGGGRMGTDYWKDPERYLKNVPYTYWNRVKMPILYLDRTKEQIRQDSQKAYCWDWPSFVALRERNQPVTLVLSRMGADLGRRTSGWIDHYLLGTPFITHQADIPSYLSNGDNAQSLSPKGK